MKTERLRWLGIGITAAALCSSAGCASQELQAERERVRDLQAQLSQAQEDRQALDQRLRSLEARNRELLEQLQERDRTAQARSEQFCSLMAQLRQMIEAGKINVRVVRNRMVVELPEAILFPSGQVDLKQGGRKALTEIAGVLAELEDRDFQVAGHTDNLPIDNDRFSSNWELSTQRAVNVTAFLIQQDLDANRLAATGYADTRPVGSNDTEEGRAQNRRIEIVLMPNLDELPDLSSLEGSCG